MTLTESLNRLDVYRIVHDFDQDYFNTDKPLRDDQVDRVIVIIQLEKMLVSFGLPLELIDNIMRRCLEDSPSVGALLLYYKNTPPITLHPLPLSTEAHYINTASKSLLVQLTQTPIDGDLTSYRKLMTWVFKHHFKKLTLDQKLELIRKSNITPWEQRSTSQKLELLGRIQAPTFWGQAKLNLQLLSWKVQFAAAWVLKTLFITCGWAVLAILWAMLATLTLIGLASLSLKIAENFSYVAGNATFQKLNNTYVNYEATILETMIMTPVKAFIYPFFCLPVIWDKCIAYFVTTGIIFSLGFALQNSILPKSVQEKGARIELVGLKFVYVAVCFFNPLFGCLELQKLLMQSINEANITVEQRAFTNAHFPELINQWLQLVEPNDTNTESLLTQQ